MLKRLAWLLIFAQNATEGFSCGKGVFTLRLTGFGKSLVKRHNTLRCLVLPLTPMGSFDLLATGSTGCNKYDLSVLNVIDRKFTQSLSKIF